MWLCGDHSAVVNSLKLLFDISLRGTCERQKHRSLALHEPWRARLKEFKYNQNVLIKHNFTAHQWYESRQEDGASKATSERWRKEEEGERAGRITDRVKLLEQCWAGVRVWIVARGDAGLAGTDGFLSTPVLFVLQAESVETCFT